MHDDQPIGNGTAVALIVTALLTDGLQAILTFLIVGIFLNPFIDVVAGFIFYVIMSHHGKALVSRRAVSMVVTALGEIVPIVNALPLWTGFAIYTVVSDRIRHARTGGAAVHLPTSVKRAPKRGWRL